MQKFTALRADDINKEPSNKEPLKHNEDDVDAERRYDNLALRDQQRVWKSCSE